MFPTSSPLCLRGCQAQGSMLHIWWDYSKIRGFWNKIFYLIRRVTGIPVTKSPQIALLNVHAPKTPKYTQKLISFMLLGAKITIAKAWKQTKVSLTAAKRKISWIMSQEKMVSSIMNTHKPFEATWEPWAKHVGISLIHGVKTS